MTQRVDPAEAGSIVDRRPVPRGVVPRGVQTWLMAALALAMLLVIFLTGQPDSGRTPAPSATSTPPPSADRVRDYQERLRILDEQSARESREAAAAEGALPPAFDTGVPAASQTDPLQAERQRKEYESLFASNVVLSRRSDAQRPDTGRVDDASGIERPVAAPERPSIDDIADAVVRSTARSLGTTSSALPDPNLRTPERPTVELDPRQSPIRPLSVAGPLHRVLEGTVIDTVLTNRLDGSTAAPVKCLVTSPVYSFSGQHILIPAGALILGDTKPVQAVGETRLAVGFHRLLMPDGSSVPLDQFRGLNQVGDAGLRDRVNHHYWSTFGAAGAVGLVSGLAQLLSSGRLGAEDGNRTVVVAGSSADSATQASGQVMNRFLNRLPTITVREGHRVKVYVTSDFDLPEWSPGAKMPPPRREP